jgi:hypothetical protein
VELRFKQVDRDLQKTGKSLGQSALNAFLPMLKKQKKRYGYLNVTAKFCKQQRSI